MIECPTVFGYGMPPSFNACQYVFPDPTRERAPVPRQNNVVVAPEIQPVAEPVQEAVIEAVIEPDIKQVDDKVIEISMKDVVDAVLAAGV